MKISKITLSAILSITILGAAGLATLSNEQFSYGENQIASVYSNEVRQQTNSIQAISSGNDGSHQGMVVNDWNNVDHLLMWGADNYFQQGSATSMHFTVESPKEVTIELEDGNEIKDIKQVVTNGSSSSAIVTDTTNKDHLMVWGSNSSSHLGPIETEDGRIETPTEVDIQSAIGEEIETIEQVEMSKTSTLVLVEDAKNEKHVIGWGENSHGELGIDTGLDTSIDTPTEIALSIPDSLITDIKQISLTTDHSGAIVTDETNKEHLLMWGRNDSGQAGIGSNETSVVSEPTMVTLPLEGTTTLIDSINEVSTGVKHTLVSVTDKDGIDHLLGTGIGAFGQLGGGSAWFTNSFKEIELSSDDFEIAEIKDINSAQYSSYVTVTDTTGIDHLMAFGKDVKGELGLGNVGENVFTPTEVEFTLENGSEVKEINAFESHDSSSTAVVTDMNNVQHLLTWGSDTSGMLGNGTNDEGVTSVSTPTEPLNFGKILTIDEESIVALDKDTIQMDFVFAPETVDILHPTSNYDYKIIARDSETNEQYDVTIADGSLNDADQNETMIITTYGRSSENIDLYLTSHDIPFEVKVTQFKSPLKEVNIALVTSMSLLLLLLILLLILLIVVEYRKVKIKSVVWVNENEVVISLNKRRLLNAKKDLLTISNFEKGNEEIIKFKFLKSTRSDGDYKSFKVSLTGLGEKTYENLRFIIDAERIDTVLFKPWRKIHGKVEPLNKVVTRKAILDKINDVEDINLEEVYGIGPKIKEYFFENGFKSPEGIVKMNFNSSELKDFVENLPGLKNEPLENKKQKLDGIKEELKYLIKELKKNK